MAMTKREAQAFERAWIAAGGSSAAMAQTTGKHSRTVQRRRVEAEGVLGRVLASGSVSPVSVATQEALRMAASERAELVKLRARAEEVERLHDLFRGGLDHVPHPPSWLRNEAIKPKVLGVPSLLLSDLHWGESVDPKQINGANEYSISIARRRLRRVFDTALRMLYDHLSPTGYPGMVLALGGDMVSGNIHEELRETNDLAILPILLDLLDHLIAGINMLLDAGMPHVFIPCVVGNHGRLDKKPRAKGAVEDNYEWLLYQMLARHFAGNKRVTVIPSQSLDYVYRVFNTGYLLTHGDQFKGGSGISGPFTPWALGDHKKRKRQNAIAQPYDVMLFGHFHTLVWGPSWVVNGSLKGYDEYSFRSNFGFEPPQQALWITHPKHGITVRMEIQAEDASVRADVPWVRIRGA